MKHVLVHSSNDFKIPVGVWTSSIDVAYLPGYPTDFDLGTRAMASRRNPDWDDWLDTLTNRYPLQITWSDMFVDDAATALSVLTSLKDLDPVVLRGLNEEDGYAGPTPEQSILPDPAEYERISEKMWYEENPIVPGN